MAKSLFSALTALLLVGCATFSAPVPQTPAQTAYAAKGTYIAVASTTAKLLENDQISADRAAQIRGYLDEVRPRLDAVVAAVKQGSALPDSKTEWLESVNTALQQILQELAEVKKHE